MIDRVLNKTNEDIPNGLSLENLDETAIALTSDGYVEGNDNGDFFLTETQSMPVAVMYASHKSTTDKRKKDDDDDKAKNRQSSSKNANGKIKATCEPPPKKAPPVIHQQKQTLPNKAANQDLLRVVKQHQHHPQPGRPPHRNDLLGNSHKPRALNNDPANHNNM